MEENTRCLLRKEAEFITRAIIDSGLFQSIVYELKENEGIDPGDAIYILNAEATKTSKIRNLLMHLERCEIGAFETFKKVLLQVGLFEVVKRLDPGMIDSQRSCFSARDDINLQMLPNKRNSMEVPPVDKVDSLPQLPRRASLPVKPNLPDGNGNPFTSQQSLSVVVKPAKVLGGSHYGEENLYKNSSMPRGLVFLVNYKDFRNNEQPTREGSEKDVKHLTLLFTQMGYEIPEVHVNLTKYETVKALREFKNLEKHKSVDSCVIIIMSHGRDDKSFYTSDNEFLNVNDIIERFNNRECEALKGKPKIFIFQYCRGTTADIGVPFETRLATFDRGLPAETDSAYQSQVVIGRDPTFTDMYIIYSTVEGFESFRSPQRGSWLMEAICMVFMEHAHDKELETLMKKVSRIVRQNYSDDGYKQVCEYTQRGFDRHFYFNPLPLNSIGTLCLRSLTKALPESADSHENHVSPLFYQHRRHLRPRSRSRSRGCSPDPFGSPRLSRQRNISGASSSSECFDQEIDPTLLTTKSISERARCHSGKQRTGSENVYGLQYHIDDPLAEYNRSFSETVLESQNYASNPSEFPRNEVFNDKPNSNTCDTVDHSQGNAEIRNGGMPQLQVQISDINMNEAAAVEFESGTRYSIKRQLSFPSSNETLQKLNDVKKYLQVHDSDPELVKPLQRIESFVNKKKYEGKRRKKDGDAASLEY
ncbi:hypothetical protein SK128_000721 [Halocaridina rubra]|uniref:Uncharacterized protein n=1 Tax=Halocaridina rubra TaxID=373956 RepID=A0AAN9ACN6_HALRR